MDDLSRKSRGLTLTDLGLEKIPNLTLQELIALCAPTELILSLCRQASPLGIIEQWDGALDEIPLGFSLCDGGTYFGVKTPDLRGSFVVGVDPRIVQALPTHTTGLELNYGQVGSTGGKDNYKLTGAESGLPEHQHKVTYVASDSSGDTHNTFWVNNASALNGSNFMTDKVAAADAVAAHENRPRYYVTAFIKRTQEVFMPSFEVVDDVSWTDTVDEEVEAPTQTDNYILATNRGADSAEVYSAAPVTSRLTISIIMTVFGGAQYPIVAYLEIGTTSVTIGPFGLGNIQSLEPTSVDPVQDNTYNYLV